MNSHPSNNQNSCQQDYHQNHTIESSYIDTLNGIDFVNVNGYTTFYTPDTEFSNSSSSPNVYIEPYQLTSFEQERIIFERSPQFQRKY